MGGPLRMDKEHETIFIPCKCRPTAICHKKVLKDQGAKRTTQSDVSSIVAKPLVCQNKRSMLNFYHGIIIQGVWSHPPSNRLRINSFYQEKSIRDNSSWIWIYHLCPYCFASATICGITPHHSISHNPTSTLLHTK